MARPKTIAIDAALNLIAREQVDTFEKRFGCFGGVEIRGGTIGADLRSDLPLRDVEMRTDGAGRMMVKGHASVFNRLSLELADMFGSFKEKVALGAFDAVLDGDPHVTLNYLHDDGMILSSTRATDPLELTVDPVGLRFFARVIRDDQTGEIPSYANDLRIAMQNNVVRQASFKFIVGRDEWLIDENDNVTRTILEVAELFDVCVCPMGAYPQTDAQLLRKRATDFAVATGRLPDPGEAVKPIVAEGAEHDGDQQGGPISSRTDAGEHDEPKELPGEDADERLRLARVSAQAKIGGPR